MAFELIRRMSFRSRRSPPPAESGVRKSASYKGLLNRVCCVEETSATEVPALPTSLICKIVDCCDMTEQYRMRTVCKAVRDHVDHKLNKVRSMRVRKEAVPAGAGWHRHPTAQLAIRHAKTHVDIVVDQKWTAHDIAVCVRAMSIYRKTVEEAEIDAPIAEMLVVSLSALDLNRWYAFLCFLKATNACGEEVHYENFIASHNRKDEVYWPCMDQLTVRCDRNTTAHLTRMMDYGVMAGHVLDPRRLSVLRVECAPSPTDSVPAPIAPPLARQLYRFRCWAGSVGFDHRFQQVY